MNTDYVVLIVLGSVIGLLSGTLLAITKMYNKQVLELTKALMSKNLTDYTVNTTAVSKEMDPIEEPDIVPAEQMTDSEFDHIIKEQLNGQ